MSTQPRLGKADLHLHTWASDGMAPVKDLLDWVEDCTDLDVVAITDHDTIEGALEARDLVRSGRYRFELLVGCELTTRQGHLLALDLASPIASYRPLVETVKAVHRQGGLCIVPHPMSFLTFSIGQRSLERVLGIAAPGGGFDGIETMSETAAGRAVAGKVRRLNRTRYGLAELGASDAHFLPQVASGQTWFAGSTAADLRAAIRARRTAAARDANRGLHSVPPRELAAQQVQSLVILPLRRLRKLARRVRERRSE